MKRLLYIDWLRIYATIAVVFIHVSAGLVGKMDPTHLSGWLAGNFFETLSRSSVPIFVMISGALLLQTEKKLTYIDFLKKRTSKVLIPLVAWSAIFYSYGVYAGYFPSSVTHAISLFLQNGITSHLWFLYMIIGLYLITPLLLILIKHSTQQDLHYFLLLWIYASFGAKLIQFLLHISIPIELSFVSNYIGYFVLGYYLHIYEISKKWRKILYFSAIIGLICTFFFTYLGTVHMHGDIEMFWYEYFSPNVGIASAGLFVFFRSYFQDNHGKIPFLFDQINKGSLGIYILHYFLLGNFLYRIFPHIVAHVHPIIAIPIDVLITLIISLLITRSLQQLPIVKKLAP
mgnify:CR=1 FL=1